MMSQQNPKCIHLTRASSYLQSLFAKRVLKEILEETDSDFQSDVTSLASKSVLELFQGHNGLVLLSLDGLFFDVRYDLHGKRTHLCVMKETALSYVVHNEIKFSFVEEDTSSVQNVCFIDTGKGGKQAFFTSGKDCM